MREDNGRALIEAKSTARSSRFETGRVATMAAGHAVHDTYTAFLPPLLPVFIEKLGLSIAGAGFLTVFMQAPSLVQPGIGRLADRFNLRALVLWAPALAAVFMSLLGVAPGYAWIALLLTLAGLNSAGLHAVAPIMTGNLSGSRLGRGMSFWMVGGELGRTLGPIIVVSVVAPLTLKGLLWLMPAGLLVSLLLNIQLKQVPYHDRTAAASPHWGTALRQMKSVFIPLTVFITLRAFLQSAAITYLPVYLTGRGTSLWFAGAALTILQAAGVAGALVSGSLSDRIGRRAVLIACVLGAPFFAWLFLSSGGLIQAAMIAMVGFFVISPTPVVMAMVQESFPENRAFANGLYMGLSFMIRSTVVVIVGLMGDHLGLHTAILICAGLMLLAFPAALFLPPNKGSEHRPISRKGSV
jgi:FSR family fosmidomycin resistance protein-like MFS transporter